MAQTEPLQVSEWMKASQKYWLQIKDIEKLSSGDQFDVLCLDRNFGDVIGKINQEKTAYRPEHFFRQNRHTYTHQQDLQGNLDLHHGGTESGIVLPNFEFHLEYQPGNWYPLQNGTLPQKDPQGFSKFPRGMPRKWIDFPNTTYVGYRGAMIRWTDLQKLPALGWEYDSTGWRFK